MPKIGMEPIRRAALVKATIDQIGVTGTLDVTVSQIAKRAGVSSALAHHYFGGKEQIFLAAMRHVLAVYATEVRDALAKSTTPRDRLEAIIRSGFGRSNFRRPVVASWLNFYVLAQTSLEARRLLTVYQGRLHSNLVYNLRPLVGDRADMVARRLGGLVDGLYLREALGPQVNGGTTAVQQVLAALDLELGTQS